MHNTAIILGELLFEINRTKQGFLWIEIELYSPITLLSPTFFIHLSPNFLEVLLNSLRLQYSFLNQQGS